MPQPSEKNVRFRHLLTVGGLLLISWVGCVLPFMGIVTVGAIVASVCIGIRWRSAWPLLVVLLNPSTVSFGQGLAEWFRPHPSFHTMGLPGYEFFNLDPESRCYRRTGGCVVNGSEWTSDMPHNAGLRLMTSILGHPRESYNGLYPSKTEAVELTEKAVETPVEIFLKDKVLADGREINLSPKTAEKLIRDFGLIFFEANLPEQSQRVRAQVMENRCLLVRITMLNKLSDTKPPDKVDGIVLFDLATTNAFARYIISGHVQRIPELLKK